MRIFGYEISQIEVAIAAAVSLLFIMFFLTRLPKWARVTTLSLTLIIGSIVFFSKIDSPSRKPVEMAKKEAARESLAAGEDEKAAVRSFEETPAPIATPVKEEKFESIEVLYGTDRTMVQDVKRVRFGDGRARQLNLGNAMVTVPKKTHKTGEIERPYQFNFLFIKYTAKEDPERHFTIHKIGTLTKEEFTNIARQKLSKSSRFKDQAFVFIHGYNVSFDAALYRTAQMAYDLGFDGVPYMYSWPSVGGLTNYEYDQNSSQQSRPYLKEFLDIVTKETGAKEVHIIAHSMGNVPTMEVLRDLRLRPDAERVSNINEVILAAPDIDRDVFINLAKEIKGLSKGITLYVSSADLAMKASRAYSGTIRAGDVPDEGPIIIDGIDTIDVTKLSTSMFYSLNHALYADSSKILVDITKIMQDRIRPPDSRSNQITRVDGTGGAVFWRYNN